VYETYPSKKHCSKFGSKTIAGDGVGTSYPGGMPGKKDDTMKVKCDSQSGNGGSAAGDSYPKKGIKSFPGLDGLPS